MAGAGGDVLCHGNPELIRSELLSGGRIDVMHGFSIGVDDEHAAGHQGPTARLQKASRHQGVATIDRAEQVRHDKREAAGVITERRKPI